MKLVDALIVALIVIVAGFAVVGAADVATAPGISCSADASVQFAPPAPPTVSVTPPTCTVTP